jgi:hypothetical protein
MKKRSTYFLILACIISLANFNNPPNGRTGAPGENTCDSGGCHNSNGANHTANVAISGFPSTLMGGETYTISLTASHGGTIPASPRLGFQLVVLDENNNNIGTLSNPNPSATITSSGGRTYAEHNPGLNSSNATWNVDFTAPSSSNSQQVTVYAIANVANGNGGTSGDLIREVTMNANLDAGGDPLMATVTKINDVLCNGEATGSAEVTATGGSTGNYSYEWDNGETSALAVSLEEGLHTVTVTDAGEIVVESVLINQPDALELEIIEQINPSCHDVQNGRIEVSASGGTGNYNYVWSNGDRGNILRNVFGGSYTVTATDENNCETFIEIELETPEEIQLSFETDDPLCHNSMDGVIRVASSGGTGLITYEWNNGETGSLLEMLGSGTYQVTAMDDNGCRKIDSVELIASEELQIEITHDFVRCFGDSVRNLTANVSGGTTPYTFLWSNGESNSQLPAVVTGNYRVTVMDNNDCQAVQDTTVSEPDELVVSILEQSALCPNDMDGSIALIPTGGTPPYSYQWNTGSTDSILQNLGGGTFTFTVNDSLGCSFEDSVTFNLPDPITYDLQSQDENTLNGMDGTASINNISGGTAPFSLNWSTGDTINQIENLAPGTYLVSITDANNCMVIDSVIIDSFVCVLSVGFQATHPLCYNTCDGLIELNIENDRTPVNIDWSADVGTTPFDSLCSGSYSYTVTDASGCSQMSIIELAEPDPILIQIDSVKDVTNDQVGCIYTTIMGGTGSLSIFLLDEMGNTIITLSDGDDFINIDAGVYTILVVDENGCERESIEIQVDLIENNSENSWSSITKVFPNPTKDELIIQSSDLPIKQVRLFTPEGILLMNSAKLENELKINLRNYPNGIYFLEMINNLGETYVQRILKY